MPLEETKQCKEGHSLYIKLGHVMRSTHNKYGRDPKGHPQPCFLLAPCTIHPFFKATAEQQCITCLPCLCMLHLSENTTARTKLYLCFCTSDPTCNFCAMVPSSSSQTLPITAGPTAYIKGLKEKAQKILPMESRHHCHQNLVLLKSRP